MAKESEPGGGKRGLDNCFARIITRCKVLHFSSPNCRSWRSWKDYLARRNNFGFAGLVFPLCWCIAPLDPMVAPTEQTEAPNPLALQMRGISKSFGPTPVLRKVDFDLRAGEIHALMGENGAGKSTLMKIAAGLIDQFDGEI